MMNEKSLLSQPVGTHYKHKQTQSNYTIIKLTFDTDTKKLIKAY